jgi:hypothetical protein
MTIFQSLSRGRGKIVVMNLTVDRWVRHSKFGDGQILEDRGDRIMVQFVTSGERLMLKHAINSAGVPPSPGFKFPKRKQQALRVSE